MAPLSTTARKTALASSFGTRGEALRGCRSDRRRAGHSTELRIRYNPRMESARHGFELPEQAQNILLVVDVIPTLGCSARPAPLNVPNGADWNTRLFVGDADRGSWQAVVHLTTVPNSLINGTPHERTANSSNMKRAGGLLRVKIAISYTGQRRGATSGETLSNVTGRVILESSLRRVLTSRSQLHFRGSE